MLHTKLIAEVDATTTAKLQTVTLPCGSHSPFLRPLSQRIYRDAWVLIQT